MPSGLDIKLERYDSKIVLRLTGRIDGSTLFLLEEKLNMLVEEKRLFLLLDMKKVEHISATGVRLLIAYRKKMEQLGGLFILFSLQNEVSDMLQMAALDKELHIASSEKKALQTKV